MKIFLNSFVPLVYTRHGVNAVNTYGFPEFIDGSCRREPDFQNPLPAITQLCRPGKLLPRLSCGDLVVYIAKKGYYGLNYPHWKFIAIIEVIDKLDNHQIAETFYLNNSLTVSQNIMCSSTAPYAYDQTHGLCGNLNKIRIPATIIRLWNHEYMTRSINYPEVAITKVYENHIYLNNPPIINEDIMRKIFGRLPVTQNPPYITAAELKNLLVNCTNSLAQV